MSLILIPDVTDPSNFGVAQAEIVRKAFGLNAEPDDVVKQYCRRAVRVLARGGTTPLGGGTGNEIIETIASAQVPGAIAVADAAGALDLMLQVVDFAGRPYDLLEDGAAADLDDKLDGRPTNRELVLHVPAGTVVAAGAGGAGTVGDLEDPAVLTAGRPSYRLQTGLGLNIGAHDFTAINGFVEVSLDFDALASSATGIDYLVWWETRGDPIPGMGFGAAVIRRTT